VRVDNPHATAMTERGFTLVELLIAAALVLVVAAALSVLSGGMHRAFDRSITTGDVTARARAGLATVAADLTNAGSGVTIGAALQGLADLTPVVLPRRSLDNAALEWPLSAVTITRATGGQGVLRERALSGAPALRLDAGAPSAQQDGTGGLQPGDTALVLDRSRVESVVIAFVDAATWVITLENPLRQTFEPGTLVAAIERTTYGLRSDANGNTRLVRRTSGGAEQPVVDHVAAFELSLWGVAEPPIPGAQANWLPSYGPSAPALDTDDDRDGWAIGENCTLASDGAGARVSRLAQLAAEGMLVELSAEDLTDGPWCPDAMDPEAFDADLLRVRRVDLRMRVDVSVDQRARVPSMPLLVSVASRER
jgi:prepilin-type N-terminal cleavage/methylation domain-containing protein